MVGYFEGIDSERGIAWRAADSLAIRAFLRIGLDETTPDHSTISRTRRLMDVETHQLVFVWLLGALDRKSTRLNSSHANISYAVFCLKKKKHMMNDHIVYTQS